MNITPQQAAAIRKLTRAANRRIERASGAQKSYIQSLVPGGSGKFSAATKGLSFEEAALKLKQLDKFMGTKTTKITEWKEAKLRSVKAGAAKLGMQGYDLTDAEFAEILKQIDAKNKQELYAAINKVQAAKAAAGEGWSGSAQEIADAIAEKMTFQQALEEAIAARPEINARRK